ncbi:signal peptidase I [Fluviispira multicolorata]|uniref:Signal peptidase I n=1 Tax=Fluviispira multicolorata TaxID=2654512 RepID=A0A833N664_9BACT|nr:signal peptidase I [Fluviispira multicolorata]KAB8032169.1 signal peptidase I [Fluviispira multicolorata]
MNKKFLIESIWVLAFIFLLILIKSSALWFYYVPSGSMMPTVILGDRILTNKLAYGLRIPFMSKPLFNWSLPKRGEIIVFLSPKDKNTFVKRVVGLPNDVLHFQNGILFVNGVSVNETPIQKITYEHFEYIEVIEKSDEFGLPEHSILSAREAGQTFFESRRFVVPTDKLFVLGDNRDNSYDSRAFGYVDKNSIYGKMVGILFSTDRNEHFFPEFRGERFLKSIK